MSAPFRYPDFSEPPPVQTPRRAALPAVTTDEALDMVASMLDAMRNGMTAPAAAQAKAMLARAGRPDASVAARHTALDAGFHSSVGA